MVMLRLIFLARAGIRNIAGAYGVGYKSLVAPGRRVSTKISTRYLKTNSRKHLRAKVPRERGGLNNVTVYLKPYGTNLLVH